VQWPGTPENMQMKNRNVQNSRECNVQMGAQKKNGRKRRRRYVGGGRYLRFFFFFSRRSTTNNQPTQSSANDKRENSAEIEKLGKWVCTDSGNAEAPVNLMKKFDAFFCK
jgi:hypothetical protein